MNWKKIAAKFVKNKKPNETLEMALKKANAHMQTIKRGLSSRKLSSRMRKKTVKRS